MERRYQVVQDGPGYLVIDTTKENGEPCNVFGSVNKAECDVKAATLNYEYYYLCPCCRTEWETEGDSDLTPEHVEAEGCPDCMSECDRCGTLIRMLHNEVEHCL